MSDGSPTVTIKFGRQYEAPWFVATGDLDEIRMQLIGFAELDPKQVEAMSLLQLTAYVGKLAQGADGLFEGLGAEPVTNDTQGACKAVRGDSVASAGPSTADIASLIEGCRSMKELRAIFDTHRTVIKQDKQLTDCFRAKRTSLTK